MPFRPRDPQFVTDPLTGEGAELRHIQPYAATKTYRCPGCNQEIPPGVGHVAIIPQRSPADRRHWHRPCWQRQASHPQPR